MFFRVTRIAHSVIPQMCLVHAFVSKITTINSQTQKALCISVQHLMLHDLLQTSEFKSEEQLNNYINYTSLSLKALQWALITQRICVLTENISMCTDEAVWLRAEKDSQHFKMRDWARLETPIFHSRFIAGYKYVQKFIKLNTQWGKERTLHF